MMQTLIREVFIPAIGNPYLEAGGDAALLPFPEGALAFTTDTFVVNPLFFPGGDIGKLAVCGTLNDLAVVGAKPLYMSAAFLLEEGLDIRVLKMILASMAGEAEAAGVPVVAADTKVVEKAKADKVFIQMSGIGQVSSDKRHLSSMEKLVPGDVLIVNGSIGEHSVAVLAAREDTPLLCPAYSDCANLTGLIEEVWPFMSGIHAMRDLTRGGLATVCCEMASLRRLGIKLREEEIPVLPVTESFCELFGYEPYYLANEGKVILAVEKTMAQDVLKIWRAHPLGKQAAIIGEITDLSPDEVILHTRIGGKRRLIPLPGEQLPRIC
jgi:hydrogenase expression/formation protein HypE